MKNPGERASMDMDAGAGAGKHNHRSSWSAFFSVAAEQLDAAVASVRWFLLPPQGRATRRRAALLAVCVAAALLTAAVVVLTAGAGTIPAASFFLDDAQGSEDIPPWNLTGDHLLDGLLTPEFSYRSCRSRYEFAGYHKRSSHKPSPYLLSKLRKQEALQKRCGPGTASHREALRRLEAGEGVAVPDADDNNNDECRYLVYISYRGLGNRMLAIASAFLYAVLTDGVLLVDGGKDIADLFCEPFPGTTWLLPRAGWWRSSSPLRQLKKFGGESKESLGNMLQSGAVSGGNGNVSWSSRRTPAYVYLHLDGSYGFHDKLFFCGEQQNLLRRVPWLLMRTDNYVVPGLFLAPPFRDELDRMFPEKDAAFYHVGRYLFHPSNAAWHAVTSYYRANLAGAGRRVGIQIRVFNEVEPPQHVLDQLLSCVHDEKLLLPDDDAAAAATSNDTSVLVTSLSWYYEQMRVRDEYAGRVHQPSHEGLQRSGDAAHDIRALCEIYLLSACDVLVTSGFSTIGYVAQGLAGLRPWVMPRSPWWAKDWREGQDLKAPACWRVASVEPCFQVPSAYDCAARRDVDLDKVTPYIKHCVDVSWGIQLVNESSSNW